MVRKCAGERGDLKKVKPGENRIGLDTGQALLQRNGHCVGQDVLLPLLVGKNELIFSPGFPYVTRSGEKGSWNERMGLCRNWQRSFPKWSSPWKMPVNFR
jgi:hypothetical protein